MRHAILALILLLHALAGLFSAPVMAMECANSGVPPGVFPDDTGDGNALACGPYAVSGGNDSVALGTVAKSPGDFSTALGYYALSTGNRSTALGYRADATGPASVSIGTDSEAAIYSAAVGWDALAFSSDSVAVGPNSRVYEEAASGVAIGHSATVSAELAVAIGPGANAIQEKTVIFPSTSSVGIGTNTPLAPIHVSRNNGGAQILVEETSPTVAPRTLFLLANPGNTKFEIMNTDANNSWAFTNSGRDFRVSLQNSGVIEFRVDTFGDAYLEGLLFENSDRNAKTAIEPVNPDAVLEKLTRLPIAEWAYKESPHSRHIGPMAQDFHAAFRTGTSDRQLATMDGVGVAIAAIQALARRNEGLETRNRALEDKNAELEQRLMRVEAMVTQLLPQTAHH